MSNFLNDKNLIFKFVPFNIYSLKLLLEGKLWFGEPNKLNDPFEGEFIIENIDEIPEEKILVIKKEMNPGVRPSWFKDLYNPTNGKQFDLEYSEFVKGQLKKYFGITSFCRRYKDLRMWSHYTGSHSGMCLVFNEEELARSVLEEDVSYGDANYDKEVPKIKLEFDKDGFPIFDGHNIFRFKYKDFGYEKEIRFIKYFNPGLHKERFQNFDKSSLKAVIFGQNMPKENRKTIAHIKINIKEYNHIRFFQSTKNFVTRKMRIEKLHGQSLVDVFEDFGVRWDFMGGIKTPPDFSY